MKKRMIVIYQLMMKILKIGKNQKKVLQKNKLMTNMNMKPLEVVMNHQYKKKVQVRVK